MAIFGQSAKGGPFAKFSKLAIFLCMDSEFILVSIDTKISMKQQELAGVRQSKI